MSIIWCGGEDIDFPNDRFRLATTTANIGPYSRCGITLRYTGEGGGYFGSYSNPFPGGAITSCWLSFYFNYNANSNQNAKLVGLGKISNLSGIYVYNVSPGKLGICKMGNSTLTQLAADSGTIPTGGLIYYKVDLEVINFGASATLNLYVDNTLKCTFSGDPRPSGMNDMDCVCICGAESLGYYMASIIVADEDTRLLELVTHYPNAAGDTNDWTGAYTNIDEDAVSNDDYIYTDNIDDDFQCNLYNTPAGSYSVKAVKIAVRAATVDSGSIKLGIESGGTINVGSPQTLDKYWTTYERLMQTNPITSAAFTTAQLDTLQLTLRSDS